ncbi:MAG: NAD-dependent epimerase/dehydratase family protein [Aureispira sp.]|nr:NAD-dependent epimerase/dehydratase family protein [Aureispira sp.]
MKRILILGGTRFIGRAFLDLLEKQDKKYNVTLFNRGKTNAHLFPQFDRIVGDREDVKSLKKLMKTDWDYVIDFSAYYPNSLKELISGLKGKVGRYIFTSTVSVYDFDNVKEGKKIKEKSPLLSCSKKEREDTSMATYGKRKVACEEVLQEADWLDKIIFRPSVVFGKYDYTDRHYYWMYRTKKVNRIIVPDGGIQRANYTFVEDYAELVLRALKIKKHRTIYNATTHRPTSLQDMLESIAETMKTKPEWISVDNKMLKKHGVGGGRDGIALWTGKDVLMFNHSKTEQDFDIQFYMMEDALAKTVEYYESLGWEKPNYGWSTKKEQKLIKKLSL